MIVRVSLWTTFFQLKNPSSPNAKSGGKADGPTPIGPKYGPNTPPWPSHFISLGLRSQVSHSHFSRRSFSRGRVLHSNFSVPLLNSACWHLGFSWRCLTSRSHSFFVVSKPLFRSTKHNYSKQITGNLLISTNLSSCSWKFLSTLVLSAFASSIPLFIHFLLNGSSLDHSFAFIYGSNTIN